MNGNVNESNDEHQATWPTGHSEWQRVSMRYAWADLTLNLIFAAIVAAVIFGFYFFGPSSFGDAPPPLLLIAAGAVVALLLLNTVLAFRRVRAIGYVLRDDDLLFRRGILFERVIAVPYGRLQLVDVTRGPMLRMLGLSTLKFVTASAATGVNLPGLRASDAEALRDRLVQLAETRRSGL